MEKEQSFKDTEAKDKDKEEASLREEISEMGQALLHADKRNTTIYLLSIIVGD